MRKLVLTSATQIASLVNNNSSLLGIPALAGLKDIGAAIDKPSNCNCPNKKVSSLPAVKLRIETALRSLSDADYQQMKSILKLDQLCYYQRINGKLQQTCI